MISFVKNMLNTFYLPSCRGADDRAAFVSLLKELRLAFEGEAKTSGQPRLLLSAAVPASFEAIAAGYDVPEISKYLVSWILF